MEYNGFNITNSDGQKDIYGSSNWFISNTNFQKEIVDAFNTVSANTAIAWNNLTGPFNAANLSTTAVSYNYTDNTIDFVSATTSADTANLTLEMPHGYAVSTDVYPHIRWIQNQDADPAWRIDYRIYQNGDVVPSWTENVSATTLRKYTYTSGTTMSQISEFPLISAGNTILSAGNISWLMDIKVYRVGADDSYSGDAAAKSIDVYYQTDTLGSSARYYK